MSQVQNVFLPIVQSTMLGEGFGYCLAPLSLSPLSTFLSKYNPKLHRPQLIFGCVTAEWEKFLLLNTALGRHTIGTREP